MEDHFEYELSDEFDEDRHGLKLQLSARLKAARRGSLDCPSVWEDTPSARRD